jgi:hypothetical protein
MAPKEEKLKAVAFVAPIANCAVSYEEKGVDKKVVFVPKTLEGSPRCQVVLPAKGAAYDACVSAAEDPKSPVEYKTDWIKKSIPEIPAASEIEKALSKTDCEKNKALNEISAKLAAAMAKIEDLKD